MSKPHIGFVGLGLMGAAMVGRLQDRGYDLTVIANRSRDAVDAAVARGASEVSSTRDLAAASDIVMLCVDTSVSVEGRMRGEDGVIAGLRPGSVVIDFGTSLPGSTVALGAEVAAAGGAMLDRAAGPDTGACGQRQAQHHGRRRCRDIQQGTPGSGGSWRECLSRRARWGRGIR